MERQKDTYYIDRVKAGDRVAFSRLVDRYRDMVYTICLRMLVVEADAEEAAQDTFLKAFRAIGSFQGKSRFSTWLYRIAYNQSVSMIRRKVKVIDLVDEMPGDEAGDADLNGLERLTAGERTRQLRLAIEALPETDAVIITLFYYEGMSLEEIADVTGLSNGNIRIRLHRSRKKMYQVITDNLRSEVSSIL